MAAIIPFLNKNLYRRYPIQASTDVTSLSGLILPDDLIASISISTTLAASNIYISQVNILNGFISLVVTHYNESTPITLGCFTAFLTQDYQEVRLTPFVPYADGIITFGILPSILAYRGVYVFNYASTPLEPTTIFCYTPPGVSRLIAKENSVTGAVALGTLENLTATASGSSLELQVTETTIIESLADLDSAFGNCPTPIIYKINETVPYSHDVTTANDDNIYLFGVAPIDFVPDSTTASLNIISPGFSLSNLCAQSVQVLPPVAPNFVVNRVADSFTGISRYYSKSQEPIVNFIGESNPEFIFWPFYVSTVTYSLTAPTTGSYSVTPPSLGGNSAVITMIKFTTSSGSLTANFQINSTQIIPNTQVATAEGLIILPTANATFTDSNTFLVDISSVTGSPNLTILVIYTIIYP